ncbi:MAG: glycoside hydrolase family 9 protein [Streptosporangiaceae bacterium]
MKVAIRYIAVAAMCASAVFPAAAAAASPAASLAAATAAPIEVRVNQVGYPSHGTKVAFAMLPARVGIVSYAVICAACAPTLGYSNDDVGSWNSQYKAVYELDLSSLTRPGTYRIRVTAGGAVGWSPRFKIGAPGREYHQLVLDAVRYFTSERDGGDVVHSVLNREPANLTDRRADVYAAPEYDNNDNLLGKFRKVGGPVNVAGGWFDAGGGYEKFAYTASYADGLMLLAARDFPRRYPTLLPEADFGLRWLEKLWRPAQRVLYIQVGIGNGNASNSIQGDYNFWFLPQAEDRMDVRPHHKPGPTAYYVKYRPVFRAAPPGKPISPDLAGRFAADFGLAAQLSAHADRPRALYLLGLARGIYAMAKTTHAGPIVTTFPHDYYPGAEWKSDMLWGAAEIVLADQALHAPVARVRADLAVAEQWARAYIAQGHPAGGDTLNLYDNGALGEGELLRALRHSHGEGNGFRYRAGAHGMARRLLADLAAQLRLGERWAKGDPFELGTALGQSDATPHAFGLYITNALYQEYGGPAEFSGFAQQQLNFALGANGWGSSFVVGAGTTFPHCMQSEIANLAGSLTGKGKIQLGAVTDGPSNPSNFIGLGTVSGMRKCSAGHYKPFNTAAAAYEDNVVSWPSVEPADDYTANSLLAFALAASAGREGWGHRG